MAEVCGKPHPDHPDVICEKARPCYYTHLNHSISPPDWDNDAKPPTTKRRRVEVDEIAENTPQEKRTGPPSPFVRTDDPSSAHEGIRRYEPKRETIKSRVLAYLQAHLNEWVDAPVLDAVGQGGPGSALRRLRELRKDGWPIETRPKSEDPATNTWQHRLTSDEPVKSDHPARDWD